MERGQPSRTALGAARHRAAHQVLEGGRIFTDPLALRILGDDAAKAVEIGRDPSRRLMRLFIAVRTRFAEDALAAADVTQVVVLGAGLDTFAYRNRRDLRIFEVDHPATQAWKRDLLAAADIAVPDALTFAPVDFERETLAEGLASAGFDPGQPTFFTWLGVVPYLTESAVFSTLGFIGGLRAHVVFDYANPTDDPRHEALAARVAAIGESFRSHFETEPLHERLKVVGFTGIEDLGPSAIGSRYFGLPARPDRGGHILHAGTM